MGPLRLRHLRELRARESSPRSGTWLVELGFALLLTPLLAFFVLRHLSGEEAVRVLGDAEIGVRLDRWSGAMTVIDVPGAHPCVPFLQDIKVLDRRPVEYTMRGTERVDGNTVPKLVVRARDGANFEFPEVVVQYTIDVARAPHVLVDSGPGEAYKAALVDVFARPILREEFGRYTTSEVLVPSSRLKATLEAKNRLQESLSPHGVIVLEVAVAKPAFTAQFETVFKRRLVANQDVESARRKIAELEAGHPERLAQVERIKDHETEIVRAGRERALEKAGLDALRGRAEADRLLTTRIGLADAERDEQLARAERLTARYVEEAEAFRERVGDLAERGRGAVRAALVDRLHSIRFDLEPREPWPLGKEKTASTQGAPGALAVNENGGGL